MKDEFTLSRRDDGRYEVKVNRVVQFVHWDIERVRRWIQLHYPPQMGSYLRDCMLGRAVGYPFPYMKDYFRED